MKYSDFIIQTEQIKEYYATLAEYNALKIENEKLKRENFGLKNRIKNLEEKLYKRNESFKGDVWDKDPKKAWRDR